MARRAPDADHPSYGRLARACRRALKISGDRDPGPGEIAGLINVSDQVVNNWRRRGVSDGAAIAAEAATGAYACWILTGEGPAVEIGAELEPWPFPLVAPARWGVCDDEDRIYVQAAINEALRAREEAREKRRAPELRAAAIKSQAARLARADLADDPADCGAPIAEDLPRDASRSDSDSVLTK